MLLHSAESRNSVQTSAKVTARFLPSGVIKILLAIQIYKLTAAITAKNRQSAAGLCEIEYEIPVILCQSKNHFL